MSLSLILFMENFWNHFWRQPAQDNRFGEKSGAVSHITGSISLPTRIKYPGNGLTAPGHHRPGRWVAREYHDTEVSTEVDLRGGMDWGRVGRNVQFSEWKILEAAVYTRQPKAPLWVLVYIRPLPCGAQVWLQFFLALVILGCRIHLEYILLCDMSKRTQ